MKLLLYCTKAKPELYITDKGFVLTDFGLGEYFNNKVLLNGKIVAECDFEVEQIQNKLTNNNSHLELFTDSLIEKKLFEKSCLNRYDMFSYLKNNFTKKDEIKGYAIYLKNLHIFDKPRELDFYSSNFDYFKKVEKAPQNMMKVWEDQESPRVLISIRPQWLCKILNGEKKIEIRKKVLKEMLK